MVLPTTPGCLVCVNHLVVEDMTGRGGQLARLVHLSCLSRIVRCEQRFFNEKRDFCSSKSKQAKGGDERLELGNDRLLDSTRSRFGSSIDLLLSSIGYHNRSNQRVLCFFGVLGAIQLL